MDSFIFLCDTKRRVKKSLDLEKCRSGYKPGEFVIGNNFMRIELHHYMIQEISRQGFVSSKWYLFMNVLQT